MKWTIGPAAAGTTASYVPTDPGNHWQAHDWTVYLSGTFGGATVTLDYSPDSSNVPDSSSRWFTSTSLTFTTAASLWFQLRFRKVRVLWSGGDGTTTDIIIEIV